MIRINLIGQKARPKPTASRGQVFAFIGLLLLEAAFPLIWHQKLSSELDDVKGRVKEATTKLDDLKRVKEAWERWQTEKADLDRQTRIFESLRSDQLGPPSMLQYLSYVLTRVADSAVGADEMKAQELIGWNPKWDPRRVWLKDVLERNGQITLKGEALDHEDVAEFYRRLQASDFFQSVEPGLQTRKFHDGLQLKMVEFSVTAQLNYRLGTAVPPEPKPG
ncbi:MAG: PilN domain-containing protein, partial [Deltaproteobacteria bacterium]|nr:PilN domain-containing protein [Deltaproteobacteria bacterium]